MLLGWLLCVVCLLVEGMEVSGLPFGLLEDSGLTPDVNVTNISVISSVYSADFTLAYSLVLLVVLFAVTVPAFIVVATIIRNKSLYKYHYWFVANLMVCDILAVFAIIPLNLTLYLVKYLEIAEVKVGCNYVFGVLFIPPVASGFMVVNLAIDAALAISYPFRYKEIMNKCKAVIMVVISWVLAASMTFPLIASPALDVEVNDLLVCPYNITVFFMLPFVRFATAIAIIGFNVYLYYVTFTIMRDCKQLLSGSGSSRKARNLKAEVKKYKSYARVSVTLLLIIIIDGVLRVARIVFAVVSVYWDLTGPVYSLLFSVAIWAEYVNHPVVYGLMLREVRQSMCCFQTSSRISPMP